MPCYLNALVKFCYEIYYSSQGVEYVKNDQNWLLRPSLRVSDLNHSQINIVKSVFSLKGTGKRRVTKVRLISENSFISR